jgi:hypothetical protein
VNGNDDARPFRTPGECDLATTPTIEDRTVDRRNSSCRQDRSWQPKGNEILREILPKRRNFKHLHLRQDVAQEERMFDQAVRASEAMQDAAHGGVRRLLPALAGCTTCRTVQMIATPMLAPCSDCGAELDVRSSTEFAVRDR